MSKSFVKRSLSVVLLFAALLCLSAPAMARPNWIGIKGKYSIVRNEKQKNPRAKDYKQIRFSVTYTNNSSDKIVTAIFNKTLSVSCTAFYKWLVYNDSAGTIKASIKSTRVSKMELYPGQSTSMYYLLPINIQNADHLSHFNKDGGSIKDIKWSHDFQVSSKGI